jgi:hypothetical protein
MKIEKLSVGNLTRSCYKYLWKFARTFDYSTNRVIKSRISNIIDNSSSTNLTTPDKPLDSYCQS